jgi:hypothetical protein
MIKNSDIFILVQTLFHKQIERMACTERVFVINMYRQGLRHKKYNETQKVSIRRLANKYNVRFEHVINKEG